MQWVTINEKLENGNNNGSNGHHHHHRKGIKGRCLHPLFGAGVTTTILALAFLSYKFLM